MKKRVISAAVLALMFSFQAKAQNDTIATNYKKQKLKIEEINFISSYYTQDGDNSAVTGGVGTEKLTDIATNLEVILSKKDKKNNIHSFDLNLGVDSYTSASSDKIDPSSVSSASYQDVRVYPSADYNYTNVEKNYGLHAGVSFSAEFDYTSIGANIGFTKTSKDKNREFSVKGMAFFDTWKVILPIELRDDPSDNEANHLDTKPRTSYNLGLTLSQVINKKFQIALLADLGYQEGLLATKFNRVYFDDLSVNSEKLPSTRIKIPVGLRANYFLNDRIILRTFYRYYYDNWGINSHTISLEPSIKLTAFSSLSLPYRFYAQSEAKYFKPINQHQAIDEFYTSDYDLSKFSSNMIGLGYHLTDSDKGIFNIKRIHSLELRYGYYTRNNGLDSHIITLALQFK
ncbi:DUF3570 domain-containing protein [Flavobacterium sangjuense]|uniref:DUF3570 domain-containing protein n=1 Tax=Flavobacterium sangjuense TaxID=2518177 RepID=A0A4P7PXQ7_9FLAO|nr:DUF3570 domain-containing protein [Flavobacterium sangjuense]QBZ99112.1 hypothetical protein GS03_02634 [Flavobacterium sangjuense]